MGQVMVVDGGQLRRLMKICRALCSGSGATVQQLQVKLKTSRRTIFRDLNSLDDMGIKVELGDKGYRIRRPAAACKKALADRQMKSLSKMLDSWLK
ncbi:MAG TPA: HTH domain-containing protein [Phycisphaerae bacterium]|nr:HTH domain-containing protein [Phycisphaerae bacterium]